VEDTFVVGNHFKHVCVVGLLSLLFAAFSLRLEAQTIGSTATISGRVLDQSGTVVPAATVTIKNDLTDAMTTVSSDATGRFLARVPLGTYTIEVALAGFRTARSTGLQVTASGLENLDIPLTVAPVNQEVTVSEFFPLAATLAPSQSSLDAHSAESVISPAFIDNFTAPTADYGEILQMAPGTFAADTNGPGLGQYKTLFRGFADPGYTITMDGIPFGDTNDGSHHTWAFFPTQFIGQTTFDRSPGTASTIGPDNFGGSVNMMSRILNPTSNFRGTVSYGSFNTKLVDGAFDTGQFGPGGKMSMLFDVLQIRADGYLSNVFLKRNAFSAKWQYRVTPKTTITAYTSLGELRSNTPDTGAATRAQIAAHGDQYLLVTDPTQGNYYGYNYYHIPSDFDYLGVTSDLGHGWLIDTKGYSYRYYNKQFLTGAPSFSVTLPAATCTMQTPAGCNGVDKLNSYRRWGHLFAASKNVGNIGTVRVGNWSEYASSYRFQYPTDVRTWQDTTLPFFKERFGTTTLQPYAEFEWEPVKGLRFTGGTKLSYWRMALTQYADVGSLSFANTGVSGIVGNLNGAASTQHTGNYHLWQPAFDVNYKLRNNWSTYFQISRGSQVPISKVFDVTNALVSVLPNPTAALTYQIGTVYKSGRFTFDFDAFHTNFDQTYSSSTDASGNVYYYAAGTSTSKGIEAESTVMLGGGLSLYLNGTEGQALYNTTHQLYANAPGNTETTGLSFQRSAWDLGIFNKRVGNMWNSLGSNQQGIRIDPFEITNAYLNYTFKGESKFSNTKLRLSFNNLFDQHYIVGVKAGSSKSFPGPGDLLTKMAGRSVQLALTFGFSPSK
jgi:iron complex outermembrane receptor protein